MCGEGRSAAGVLWGGGASSGQSSSLERVERVRGLRSARPNCCSCRSPRAGSATCTRRRRGLTYYLFTTYLPASARAGPLRPACDVTRYVAWLCAARHVAWLCAAWHVRVACTRGMYARHVRVACTRGMYAWHVRVACTRGMYAWHVRAACVCARAGRVSDSPPSPLLLLSEKELERLFRDESFPAPGLCASSASLLRVDESAQLVLDSRTPSTTGSGGAEDGLKMPKMPRFAGFAPGASR